MGSCFLICGYSINLQAQDRYRNFLEELDHRDEAYILRLKTLKIDGIVIMKARLRITMFIQRMDVFAEGSIFRMKLSIRDFWK